VERGLCSPRSIFMVELGQLEASAFVAALLDCDREDAREALCQVTARYPIVVTRDLTTAKEWVRRHARGSEQYGPHPIPWSRVA
jgi:hypothetical protein